MTHPQDEAFGAAIKALGEKHKVSPQRDLDYAVKLARHGFISSAWNDALMVGIPHDELSAVQMLIYDKSIA